MEYTIEGCVSELVNNPSNSLPDVLCIAEAFNTVWDFSLNSTSKETFKNLTHSEEGEVDV